MLKLPKASYSKSFYSAAVLGVILGIGEGIGGNVRIILGIISTILIGMSGFIFVRGFANIHEIDPRKSSYWKAHFPITKRCMVFVLTLIIFSNSTFRIVKYLVQNQ